jgi:hypothetical protein
MQLLEDLKEDLDVTKIAPISKYLFHLTVLFVYF